jgi:nucleoside-diphosphate-sugar epimerase
MQQSLQGLRKVAHRSMRTVITGGAGFIGSALARMLVERAERGGEIFLVDNLERHGETALLRDLGGIECVTFIHADLT